MYQAIVATLFLVIPAMAAPKVLLHESFDETVNKRSVRGPAIRGNAAWFTTRDAQESLRLDLKEKLKGDEWTIALWQIIEVKEWLAAPEDNLLRLLDADGQPIISLTKSGGVFVHEQSRTIHLDCFDALYWVRGSREHLTLTWDANGSGVAKPKGMLRAFWKARPYASLAVNLDRTPVTLEIGGPSVGLAADDLFVLDEVLSLRAIWDLMRYDGSDVGALEKLLAQREAIEAERATAKRLAAWAKLAREGKVIEAEANAGNGKVVVSPTPPEKGNRHKTKSNNASTASGRACVEPGNKPLTFHVQIDEAGEFALALRYCLQRKMHPLWPQNSTAKTPWTENYAQVEVQIDGKPRQLELYPTGTYNGHAGDVEMWAWHVIDKVNLDAGKHAVQVAFKGGLAQPIYDALLVSNAAGPMPTHPRHIDQYRVPPSWWVSNHKSTVRDGNRFDTYIIELKNRCEEPCSYEIVVGTEKMQRQKVSVDRNQMELKPFETQQLVVTFESPASLENNSEWANIYLWNSNVALRQKYRLWNLIPAKSAATAQHPVLTNLPDPKLQTAFREWLKSRDPKQLTTALKNWTRSQNFQIADGSPVRGFPSTMSANRLAALDAWMKMSASEIEQYLPDGPAEFNGYGSGWERTGVDYAGIWHKMPKVKSISPPGDIDFVTSLTVEAPPQKGKTETYRKTYSDTNLICCVRDTRWASMMGHKFYGAAPHQDTPLGREPHTGITLLAEAYYLTGDKAYARKAYQMLRVFARKYTHLTKHFYFTLHREDRDWWGGRIGGRYLSKFGPRYYHAMGIYVLDLIWNALTPQERSVIEHNVVRWGMYEAMSGPLFETPEYFAAVNKEDMPFLTMGKVLGDPAPVEGLSFFYDVFRDVVLPDGIHKCSLGSYGGVNGYATFLKKLSDLGLDVKQDPALRKLFSAHPSFIFSGGGFPNIDDGGGVNLNGLGAGFGSPNKELYAWAKQLYGDKDFGLWPNLIAAAQRVNSSPPKTKADVIRKEYADNKQLVEKLWPNVYIAPVKGLAILRNRESAEPIDWKEVIFDYGLHGGRSHGHAAKLATIPSFNGQIVSMEYGYGMLQPVGSGFHTRSYAHNVVVADGKSQFGGGAAVQVGQLRESHGDAKVQWIDAESTKIYDGIYMRRTVFTTDFGIVDLHGCRSDEPHEYDWMFHSFGEASGVNFQLAKEKLADSGPLTFARNPRTHTTDDPIQVIWENSPRTKPVKKSSSALLHEKAYVRLWSLPVKDTTVALFGIQMTEAVGGEIDYAMLRRNAKSTVFATVQEPWRESTRSKVASIQQLPVKSKDRHVADHEAYAIEVTQTDGIRCVFFVNYSNTSKSIGRVTTNAHVATWTVDKSGNVRSVQHTKDRSLSVQ